MNKERMPLYTLYNGLSFILQDKGIDGSEVKSEKTKEIIAGLTGYNKLPAFRVDLKVGCRAVLTKNKEVNHGWVNGKRVIVERLSRNPDFVVIQSTKNSAWRAHVTREKTEILFKNQTYKLFRWQIPLELGYGLTIHKSQGQTLNPTVVSANYFFGSGMGYTACSRAVSLDRLFFLVLPTNKEAFNVYPQVIELLEWFNDYDVLNGWDGKQRRRELPHVPVTYGRIGAPINPQLAKEERKVLEELDADLNERRMIEEEILKEKMEIYNRRHNELHPADPVQPDAVLSDEQIEFDDILESVLPHHPRSLLVREITVVLQKLRLIPVPTGRVSSVQLDLYVAECQKVLQFYNQWHFVARSNFANFGRFYWHIRRFCKPSNENVWKP